jgi:hypothetical protein
MRKLTIESPVNLLPPSIGRHRSAINVKSYNVANRTLHDRRLTARCSCATQVRTRYTLLSLHRLHEPRTPACPRQRNAVQQYQYLLYIISRSQRSRWQQHQCSTAAGTPAKWQLTSARQRHRFSPDNCTAVWYPDNHPSQLLLATKPDIA